MRSPILLFAALRVAAAAPITLSASGVAHTFTGNGGLSAGASSRLLQDYAPEIRSDILDMLFLPNHGLGLDILKVEIGGDTQSTDGTEPSHEHFRGDLSCTRGYETGLALEARRRNPDVAIYGLSWGAPGWIGNQTSFFTEEMWEVRTSAPPPPWWARPWTGSHFLPSRAVSNKLAQMHALTGR